MKKLLLLLLIFSPCLAHVPQYTQEGGDVYITEPLKSWVYYDYNENNTVYYQATMNAGDKLVLNIITPDPDFIPDLGIYWKNGSRRIIISGGESAKEYEPFTPTSFYVPVSVEGIINETDTYYFMVNSSRKSSYGLVIGYEESFTIPEWLSVPIDAIRIHMWEGQNIALILTPLFATLAVGLAAKRHELKKMKTRRILYTIGGLTYIGTSLMTFMQMIIGLFGTQIISLLWVTPLFMIYPIVAGRLLVSAKKLSGTKLVLFSITGVFLWAGLFFGPAIILAAAFLPQKK